LLCFLLCSACWCICFVTTHSFKPNPTSFASTSLFPLFTPPTQSFASKQALLQACMTIGWSIWFFCHLLHTINSVLMLMLLETKSLLQFSHTRSSQDQVVIRSSSIGSSQTNKPLKDDQEDNNKTNCLLFISQPLALQQPSSSSRFHHPLLQPSSLLLFIADPRLCLVFCLLVNCSTSQQSPTNNQLNHQRSIDTGLQCIWLLWFTLPNQHQSTDAHSFVSSNLNHPPSLLFQHLPCQSSCNSDQHQTTNKPLLCLAC